MMVIAPSGFFALATYIWIVRAFKSEGEKR